MRCSLVEMVRRHLPVARKQGRTEKEAHDAEKLQRREEAVQRQLDASVERYAAGLELFAAWESQGVKNTAQLDKQLKGKSENEQVCSYL